MDSSAKSPTTEAASPRGTGRMDPPAPHPQSEEAAWWGPHRSGDEERPYVLQPVPVHRPAAGQSPMENILDALESWTRKAETLASNVWHSLKTAPNKSEAAWGKLSLTAKAITEGGFESLYRQTFPTDPSESLKKTFACYISTATGPVAGTLYLSNITVAFCSDRPLSFTAPSEQEAWSFYKVAIPLSMVTTVNPVAMTENEKYIQVVTVDGHEFWFMGFVNYDKASMHLLDAVSDTASMRLMTPEAPAVAS